MAVSFISCKFALSISEIMTNTEKYTLDIRFERLMSQTWETRMGEVNLVRNGWTFGYNNRKSAFGVCKLTERRIELSSAFINTPDVTFDRMLDTILHEIAHALELEVFGTGGHGRRWVEMCGVTGADPSRTHDGPAPVGRYEAICTGGHGVLTHFHRKPTRSYLCPKCKSKIKINDTKAYA